MFLKEKSSKVNVERSGQELNASCTAGPRWRGVRGGGGGAAGGQQARSEGAPHWRVAAVGAPSLGVIS